MKSLLLTLALALLTSAVCAQSSPSPYRTSTQAPRIYVKSTEQRSGYLGIQYEINFPGFVELHLYKNEWIAEEGRFEKKLLLIRGKVTDRAGVDYISFPVAPLEAGERYPFELHYKGDTISRSVSIE